MAWACYVLNVTNGTTNKKQANKLPRGNFILWGVFADAFDNIVLSVLGASKINDRLCSLTRQQNKSIYHKGMYLVRFVMVLRG
jgi:hypothetical protein